LALFINLKFNHHAMKRIVLLLTLFICACNHFESKQQRAQDLVTHYLKSTLNDPDSYESVSFSKLYKLSNAVIFLNGKPDTITRNGWFEILHTYRAKNKFGGVITHKYWFQVDSSVTKVNCCYIGQHNEEEGNY